MPETYPSIPRVITPDVWRKFKDETGYSVLFWVDGVDVTDRSFRCEYMGEQDWKIDLYKLNENGRFYHINGIVQAEQAIGMASLK